MIPGFKPDIEKQIKFVLGLRELIAGLKLNHGDVLTGITAFLAAELAQTPEPKIFTAYTVKQLVSTVEEATKLMEQMKDDKAWDLMNMVPPSDEIN